MKRKTFAEVMEKDPTRIIREAVSGMLPKNKLRALMLKRLYIYSDEKHPYQDKIKKLSRQSGIHDAVIPIKSGTSSG